MQPFTIPFCEQEEAPLFLRDKHVHIRPCGHLSGAAVRAVDGKDSDRLQRRENLGRDQVRLVPQLGLPLSFFFFFTLPFVSELTAYTNTPPPPWMRSREIWLHETATVGAVQEAESYREQS